MKLRMAAPREKRDLTHPKDNHVLGIYVYEEGFLEKWTPKMVEVDVPKDSKKAAEASFFDVASASSLYVSRGGMRNLCESLAAWPQERMEKTYCCFSNLQEET